MTVNELRKGNYLSLPTRGEELVIVEEILRDDFVSCNVTTNEWPISDYNPILLTEEWLLKFGFEKQIIEVRYGINESLERYDIDGHGFIQDNDGKWFLTAYNWNHEHIEYVHQLQNLYFALTGEELEIIKS